jgi:PIN like domain
MRKGFEHYYRLSKHDLSDLWQACVFVFDTNVLLDLYRYTPETKDELFAVLERLEDRIWIPHQVALEFHRNRLETVAAVFEPYRKIKGLLTDTRERILEGLSQLSSKHPFIKVEKMKQRVAEGLTEIIKELEESAEQHPNQAKRADEDDIRERLTKLFENKTGEPFDENRMQEIAKEGETRYANKIPPGYMDGKTKARENKFGDLIL